MPMLAIVGSLGRLRCVRLEPLAPWRFLCCLALLASAPGSLGCTLITDVDRSKIPQEQRPPFPEVDAGQLDAAVPPGHPVDAGAPDADVLDAAVPSDAAPADAAPDGGGDAAADASP